MPARAWLLLACLVQPVAYAAELAPAKISTEIIRPALNDARRAIPLEAAPAKGKAFVEFPMRSSRFSQAIGKAARKGIVEQSVEGYTEVLIQCQNERSTVLTTPFMRSDSQQAHCFRF